MSRTGAALQLRKGIQRHSIFIVLLGIIVISACLSPNFLRPRNITNVFVQLTVATILAYGEMLLIIGGMLDLSCGSVIALAGVLSVSSYKATGNMMLAILVALAVAVACNMANGFFIAKFRLPAFIVTLAMQMIARGLALLYTHGQNIVQIGRYSVIGQGRIFGAVPIPVLFLIGITIIIWYVLNQTRLGRSIYAIGGNEEAAVAAGIRVERSKYLVFLINGLLVGIAAVIFMSRVNAGLPNGAISYEMEGLTATIVGGTSFSGGIGTVSGTIAGAFIIGCINNIMNLQGVDAYIQQVVKGVIIIGAVLYDVAFKNRKAGKVILARRE